MNIDCIIALANENSSHVLVRHAKMVEECGEFAEALLIKQGYLTHKVAKEPMMGELADVIICALDTAREAYNYLSDQQFKDELQKQLDLKAKKWEDVIIAPQRKE